MKAIIVNQPGGVEELIHTDIEIPVVSTHEVLVKVKAISINPVDVKARANEGVLFWIYGDERPVVLGWDISGEIVAVGKDVADFKIGDEVFGMVNFFGNGRAYAEYVAVPAIQLALKPAHITHEEAAAATLAATTAWQALVEPGKIKAGEKVLIHGAAGGVGHYAVQMAKYLGAYVIGTSSAANKEFVLSLGADEHIDYTTENFEEKLADIDFALSAVSEEVLLKTIKVIKTQGKILTLPSPEIAQEILDHAAAKNIELSFMLVQSNGDHMKKIAQLLADGNLKSHVSRTFRFEEMDKAHLQIETGRTRGKVVVKI